MKTGFFYVYILRTEAEPPHFYTGFTEDLDTRLKHHNFARLPLPSDLGLDHSWPPPPSSAPPSASVPISANQWSPAFAPLRLCVPPQLRFQVSGFIPHPSSPIPSRCLPGFGTRQHAVEDNSNTGRVYRLPREYATGYEVRTDL